MKSYVVVSKDHVGSNSDRFLPSTISHYILGYNTVSTLTLAQSIDDRCTSNYVPDTTPKGTLEPTASDRPTLFLIKKT
ncbi:MAG: hypothetical protein F6K30_07535 [Cyanothece sp. SIO2G6]|nr:hypothetical protein [Cyanothece sp. SIO2G6]